MTLTFLQSLIFAGIAQGFIVGAILLRSRSESSQRIWLGLLVLSFAFDNLQYFLADTGAISQQTLRNFLYIPYGFLSAPLYLLYTQSLNGKPTPRSIIWLFLPFLIGASYSAIYKFQVAFDSDFTAVISWNRMEMIFEFGCIFIDFSMLALLMARNPDTRKPLFEKGRIATGLLIFTCIAWLMITIADYLYDTELWELVYINMSIIIYGLGHAELFRGKTVIPPAIVRMLSKKTEGRSVAIEQFENIIINEKRFLDPNLSLDDIASQMNLSKSHLSRIINTETQSSFPDYLNKLRVEEAKSYLADATFENYTLSAIGLEAGFASKTTFNTTFKKFTGMTPSEYKQSVSLEFSSEKSA